MLGFDTCLGSAGGGELRLRCLHEAGALNVSKGCAVLSRSVMSDSCDPRDCSPPGSSIHGASPGKNTGVGCHALLQEIFLTQGSNSGLPHCSQILYHLSHQGSPRISERVAYLFSRRTSQPRNQTGVSCIAEILK